MAETADGVRGADGTPSGVVTEFDSADAGDGPMPLVATTRNVYAVPGVRPVMAIVPDAGPDSVPLPPGGIDAAL